MVALLRLGTPPQELVQLLLRAPDRPVDPLELGALLVATPVGRRDGQQPEGADPARRRHMGPAAQVAERPVLVEADHGRRLPGCPGLRREVVEDLDLEALALALDGGAGVVELDLLADERVVGRHAGPHPVLDRREVVGRQPPRQVEVVIEAVGDGRPDPELGAGKEVEDGLGHHVGRRVAHRVELVVRTGVEQLVDGPALRCGKELVVADLGLGALRGSFGAALPLARRALFLRLVLVGHRDHHLPSGESKRPLVH
jgi:hypothetical protein